MSDDKVQVKSKPVIPPHSMSVAGGFKPGVKRSVSRAAGVPTDTKMADQRKSITEKFNAQLGNGTAPKPDDTTKLKVPSDTPPEEGATGTSPDQDLPLDPVAAKADEESLPLLPGETPPEDPDDTPTPGDKIKDQKMVPLGALHEEREKHRTTKREVTELRSQVDQLLADFKKFSESGKPSSKGEEDIPEPIDDVETAIRDLRGENKRLRAEIDLDRETRNQDSRKHVEVERGRFIDETDKELAAEGLNGFKMFIDRVGSKLVEIHKINPELANKLDTPAGWKRIYKEKVYPEISGLFVAKQKEEGRQNKLTNKNNAGLSGSPGVSGTPSPEPKKAWNFDDYLTWRRKVGVS